MAAPTLPRRRETSPPRLISLPASRRSKVPSRTAYRRASSKPSNVPMFTSALDGCGHRARPDRQMWSITTTRTSLAQGSRCALLGSSSRHKLNSRLSGQKGTTPPRPLLSPSNARRQGRYLAQQIDIRALLHERAKVHHVIDHRRSLQKGCGRNRTPPEGTDDHRAIQLHYAGDVTTTNG